ncbi:MAG: hypothetical protein ACRDE2_17820, partial [Chitinophagaceae bacterium]
SSSSQPERTEFAMSVSAALKVTNGSLDITNGATLYYSPIDYNHGNEPSWDFSKLIETFPQGVDSKYFRFFKEKK